MTTIRQSRRTFILKRKQYLYSTLKSFIFNILQLLKKRKCSVLHVICKVLINEDKEND